MHTSKEIHAVRFAVTTAVVFVVGVLCNWESAYLAAVFTSILLERDQPLPVPAGVVLFLATSCIYLLTFVVFKFLLNFPLLFFIGIVAALAIVFAMSVAGKSPLIVIMSLFAVLIIPYVATSSIAVAWTQTIWLPLNLAIAIVATWCAFSFLPPRHTDQQETTEPEYGNELNPKTRFVQMMLSSTPFVVFYLLIDGSHLLTLLYVGLFCTQLAAPSGESNVSPFEKLVANLIGALVALIAYEIMVIAPMVLTMILAILVICLSFGWWLTSERDNAKLARSALTGLIILLGDAMSPIADTVEVSLVERIFEISAAVIIATIIFELVRVVTRPIKLSENN